MGVNVRHQLVGLLGRRIEAHGMVHVVMHRKWNPRVGAVQPDESRAACNQNLSHRSRMLLEASRRSTTIILPGDRTEFNSLKRPVFSPSTCHVAYGIMHLTQRIRDYPSPRTLSRKGRG